jgi:glycosyltransferase involved in cell wall biosynthesis
MNTSPAAIRLHSVTRTPPETLRIALLAPPWIPVPPPGYGGIEAVVTLLCEELVARGHDVTLFAAPGSRSAALVYSPLPAAHPDTIGSALHEADHVAGAWDEVDRLAAHGWPFDVIHDHSGFTALAMAARAGAPVVHTVHGPLDADTAPFYARHGRKATLVALSHSQFEHAPDGVRAAAVVPNPLDVAQWPLRTGKDDYLLWIGRMSPVKGAHHAIAAALRAGRRLVLAGPVQPGQETYFRERVAPHIDGERVVYVGEVGGARRMELFAGAQALLMPIRWVEPFGMVMIEALACGTPVIAFPEGAAAEVVLDGENGFLVADERAMAPAVTRLPEIDPLRCRHSVASRYSVAQVADGYEAVYRRAVQAVRYAAHAGGRSRPAPWERPAGRTPRHERPAESVPAVRRAARTRSGGLRPTS